MRRKLAGLTVFVVLLGAWAASAQTIYGSATSGVAGPATLYLLSPTTGAATPIGPINFLQVGALAFAPNGTLYGMANTASSGRGTAQLLTINPTTGAGTLVGDTGLPYNFNDLAFRSDGTLFGLARTGRNLYTIDTTTGRATLVGSTVLGPGRGAGNGMAFSAADVLYTADQSELDVLDQATGARTPVVALDYSQFGPTESRANGMKFDPVTGTLYATVVTVVGNGQQARSLGTMNIATGVVTRIGPTIANLHGMAIASPLPPPSLSFCAWGLYIHSPDQGWESRLFISNIDTQRAHNYAVFVLTSTTVRSQTFPLPPSGIRQLLCGDLNACGTAGWLVAQSDAPMFGATLFVINNIFGGGAFTAQSPDCLFGTP